MFAIEAQRPAADVGILSLRDRKAFDPKGDMGGISVNDRLLYRNCHAVGSGADNLGGVRQAALLGHFFFGIRGRELLLHTARPMNIDGIGRHAQCEDQCNHRSDTQDSTHPLGRTGGSMLCTLIAQRTADFFDLIIGNVSDGFHHSFRIVHKPSINR